MNKYLEEVKLLEAKWNKLFPNGMKDKFSRAQTAVLLQSHRLINEGPCWCGDICKGKKDDEDKVRS